MIIYLVFLFIIRFFSQDDVKAIKKGYVRYLSHELRNPLNAILMGIQLSRDKLRIQTCFENGGSACSEILEDTLIACETALQILNELLMYDKIENGQLSMHKNEVNVVDLISNCIMLHSVQLQNKEIQLNLFNANSESNSVSSNDFLECSFPFAKLRPDSEKSLIYEDDVISVDEIKISQVISNIICNAITFTPSRGKIDVKVEFIPDKMQQKQSIMGCKEFDFNKILNLSISNSKSCKSNLDLNHLQSSLRKFASVGKCQLRISPILERDQDDDVEKAISSYLNDDSTLITGLLVMQISDNGIGMDVESQQNLFHDFGTEFQPDVLHHSDGSGLGMYISNKIVQLHGGKYTAACLI